MLPSPTLLRLSEGIPDRSVVVAPADNDCTKDGNVFAQAKLQFPAVAQMVGFGPETEKCFTFQWGLTDTFFASRLSVHPVQNPPKLALSADQLGQARSCPSTASSRRAIATAPSQA
jgi:hypothetical protein